MDQEILLFYRSSRFVTFFYKYHIMDQNPKGGLFMSGFGCGWDSCSFILFLILILLFLGNGYGYSYSVETKIAK